MESLSDIKKIEIEQDTLRDLDSTRKWTMFLAILGFIGIGLLLIVGLFAGVFLSVFNTTDIPVGFPEWLLFIIILICAAIYFFPVFFLFRFSKSASNAVKSLDKLEMQKAFRNLKFYFVYLGILVIVVLAVYFIAFVAAGASISFLKDLG